MTNSLKNKKTNLFSKLLVCLLVLALSLPLFVACGGGNTEVSEDQSSTDESSTPSGTATKYNVTVKSAGGMALQGLSVYVYAGANGDDLQNFAQTDMNGTVSFDLIPGADYIIKITGAPKGYDVAESYKFTGTSANITLSSALIKEELSTATLGTGDIMYDFTIPTAKGETITLSEILKEKKMVMLNFWYTNCSWCLTEFPIMNEVYSEYKEDIEIIALDPYPNEDNAVVKAFQEQNRLDFIMASCPASWANTFGITGYPTSVFIDRYGTICLVEAGAITSKRPFVNAFDHFIAEDYKQKLCTNGIGDLVTQIVPNVSMDTSENVSAVINQGDITVTYHPEEKDENAQYIWPFLIGNKLGQDCLYASNKGIDDSYAIFYADVTLKAGQALCFDYLVSSERLCDIMYVIVNGEDVYQISGVSDPEEWKSCYPVVADKDGVYEVAFCFTKDSDSGEGDDTVYIDNLRVVNEADIDTATYLPRYAAKAKEDGTYSYVDIVFNETDGYYHVGSANGPLLIADLMNYCQFNEELSVYEIVYNGDADKDGVSLYEKEGGLGMVKYFSLASNSSLSGTCTVNKELSEMLKQVAEVAGFDGDANEWLKICKYYEVYGPNATQLQDPIKGLAPFSAFKTELGKNVETNYFYYDHIVMPRGYFSEFIPAKSGVYRFTSKSDYQDGIDGWIFDENGEIIFTYEFRERMYDGGSNCSMVYYMEAGKPYYINMAFWDVYATGYIYYDVEYLGASIKLFSVASPGYFTYDSDATGNTIYGVIAGGITPVLKDGKYYDSEDGSLIYADFIGSTGIFDMSISKMIDMGGFDFSKSETDGEVLAYLKQHNNDVEATKAYLKELWGEEYEQNAEVYQLDDVFAGRYHGKGEDYTEEIRGYLSKVDKSGKPELEGCVVVDERLAELLQMLLDKYTFEGVENSWLKVCYYYDYLGAK